MSSSTMLNLWKDDGTNLSPKNDREVIPQATDGAALGSATVMWSDLFLASGGVINFNNGNVIATHSAGLLTLNSALTMAGLLTNTITTDSASVQVAILQGDRATMADNDEAYLTLRLSDSAGNQDEQARITWKATTVLNGATQDGDLILSSLVNNSLTTMLTLDGSAGTLVAGVDLEIGALQITEDAGAVELVDMSVSAAGAGVEESYAFKIDNTTILQVYAEGNGSGGIQNAAVKTAYVLDANVAGVAAALQNTTDAAGNQVLTICGPNRVTPADSDAVYVSFLHETSTTVDTETERITGFLSDATHATRAGGFIFHAWQAATQTEYLRMYGASAGTDTGFITFNEDGDDLDFRIEAVSRPNALFLEGSSGNLGIGTATFGTNAVGSLSIANATAPTALVANQIQIYSVDSSDATATLGLFLEQAVENIGTFTASHKIKFLLNGVEYWLQLDAVA